ncbi:hypothetical protein OG331_05690 [Streptomyces sp. NBC_01017]|nr:hypothetical protein OG331_05690 [Streptomyces sp. NBC_01017]
MSCARTDHDVLAAHFSRPRYLSSVADRHGVPLEVRNCGAAVRRRAW